MKRGYIRQQFERGNPMFQVQWPTSRRTDVDGFEKVVSKWEILSTYLRAPEA